MDIELMTGDNFNFVHLAWVARNVDGTASPGSYSWDCAFHSDLRRVYRTETIVLTDTACVPQAQRLRLMRQSTSTVSISDLQAVNTRRDADASSATTPQSSRKLDSQRRTLHASRLRLLTERR